MPFVQAGEVKLHYVEHGAGPEPLVFVHGYTSSSNNWVETLPRLPERYRAIAFDLRGAGESDKPASGYGPAIYAEDIHRATRALGIETFTYIGHSMGGVTGMQFAVSHPERLKKLVLVAPAPSGGINLDPAIWAQIKAMRANREMRRLAARMINPRPMRDELLDMNFDDDQKWPEAAYDEAWQAMVHLRLSDALAGIKTPALVIAGDRDPLLKSNLEDAARIPNCALHVFYRVGHLIPFDVPDEFVALLDDFITYGVAAPNPFLQRAAAGGSAAGASAGGSVTASASASSSVTVSSSTTGGSSGAQAISPPSTPPPGERPHAAPSGAGGVASAATAPATDTPVSGATVEAAGAGDTAPAPVNTTAGAASGAPSASETVPPASSGGGSAARPRVELDVPGAVQLTADERELIARVRGLARGEFMQRAGDYDRDGRFPHENVEALRRLGIAGLSLPKDVGGLGIGPVAQMRVMEEIAYGDASTAVAINMHRIGADLTVTLPPFPARAAVLDEIIKNGAFLCAPGSIPTGELDNRRAGFRAVEQGSDLVISGRTGFASMSEGATYVFLVATIDRGEGQDGDIVFALPRIDAPGFNLKHNWDAMGLRATASHDVECDGLVIPKADALVLPLPMLRAVFEMTQKSGGVAVQRRGLGSLGILATWLGLAQAAYDFTVEYVAQRHGYLAGTVSALGTPPGYRSEQAWAQLAIGEMEHWLESGRTVFYDIVSRIETPYPDPQSFTRHLVRTVYHLRRMTEEVGMGAMKVCGAHAYVKNRPLERIFRDMMGGVVMAWKTDELAQTIGRGALGLPITIVGPAGS